MEVTQIPQDSASVSLLIALRSAPSPSQSINEVWFRAQEVNTCSNSAVQVVNRS